MKKTIAFIMLLAISLIFLNGCTTKPENDSNPILIQEKMNDAGVTVDDINTVVEANNKFSIDLYKRYSQKDENVFFSPYSISTALAMTYEGARGQTAEEMQKVFYFPAEDIRRPGFAALYNDINANQKDYTLKTANALWAQKDFTFLSEYFNVINQYYGGNVTNLDFIHDTENSRVTINKWVEAQTNNKIVELLPKDPPVIKSDTRLVLTNAIYFKGTWKIEFDKKNTRERDFFITPEQSVKAQMMYMNGEKAVFNYYESENMQILELPYKGEELSMLLLLPKENDLPNFEQSLTLERLNSLRNMLQEREIAVALPKFKFETKYFMVQDLIDMGMPTAFDEVTADFSGMTGKDNLYISNVIHQAFVEVNEEGTEAAAATAVIMAEKVVAIQEVFNADHPFIFIIQQKSTGNILFMGKVTDPTK